MIKFRFTNRKMILNQPRYSRAWYFPKGTSWPDAFFSQYWSFCKISWIAFFLQIKYYLKIQNLHYNTKYTFFSTIKSTAQFSSINSNSQVSAIIGCLTYWGVWMATALSRWSLTGSLMVIASASEQIRSSCLITDYWKCTRVTAASTRPPIHQTSPIPKE